MTSNGISIPAERVAAAQSMVGLFSPNTRIVLTTHVNADGDGLGSEVGSTGEIVPPHTSSWSIANAQSGSRLKMGPEKNTFEKNKSFALLRETCATG